MMNYKPQPAGAGSISPSNTNSTHNSVSSRVPSSIANDSQKGVFFLISRKVTLAYGPYVIQGVMDYRTERLEGLMRALRKAGAEVLLKPSYHINEVRVWHLEHKIFSCKITDLQHGGDGDLDLKCVEAGYALESNSRKAHFNLKHRYRIVGNFESPCPCHPPIRSNTRVKRRQLQHRTGKNITFGRNVQSTGTTVATSLSKASSRKRSSGTTATSYLSSFQESRDREASRNSQDFDDDMASERRKSSNASSRRRSVSLPTSRTQSRRGSTQRIKLNRLNSIKRESMDQDQENAYEKRRSSSFGSDQQQRKNSNNSEEEPRPQRISASAKKSISLHGVA